MLSRAWQVYKRLWQNPTPPPREPREPRESERGGGVAREARAGGGCLIFWVQNFIFFTAENICVPKSDPKLGFIDLGAEVKMENCTKKGKLSFLTCTRQGNAQHREMHNTGSCTTQGVVQHRELHNTGICTIQGDAQRHSSLNVFFRGSAGRSLPRHA